MYTCVCVCVPACACVCACVCVHPYAATQAWEQDWGAGVHRTVCVCCVWGEVGEGS